MEQLRNPTEEQRGIILQHKLNPDNWRVAFESKGTLEVVSCRSAQRRTLQKKSKKQVKIKSR